LREESERWRCDDRGRGNREDEERTRIIQSIIHLISFLLSDDQIKTIVLKPSFKMSDLFTATTAAQVESLIASTGDDVDSYENPRGWSIRKTPLISAIKRGLPEVVDCLLNHGANVGRYFGRVVAIHVAAQEGHADILERLVRAGADINDTRDGNVSPPLSIASQMGHVDVVDRLLSLGANVNTKNPFGVTSLMMASGQGRIDVVDRLLAAGSEVNAIANDGISALMMAAAGGYVPIIDRLVVHGAEINVQNKFGWNALMEACKKGHIKVVDRLLSLSCDVDAQDQDGETALMKACSEGRIDVVRLLLDHGADPLLCDKDGHSAIIFGARSPEIQTLLNGLILLSFHHHHHHHVP